MLVCPICKKPLEKVNTSLKCPQGHCYDIAKEGYVNLLRKNSVNHGDNKEMVLARRHFLEKDYYAPLCNGLIELLGQQNPATLVDLGCGEGYYTHRIAYAFPACQVYGNDISKEAIRLASKKDASIHYFIASSSDLPIENESIDAVTCLFSFYDFAEVRRILKKDGKLLVVVPGPKHLYELKEIVYDTPYLNEVKEMDSTYLTPVSEVHITYPFVVESQEAISELFGMTPYAFKTKKSDSAKLETISTLTLTADFTIQIYSK